MGYDQTSDMHERDEVQQRIDDRRLERDGYIDRPVSRDIAPPRDVAVLRHMRDTGGSFVSKLADAWFSADPRNQSLLYMAFGDIYRRYRDSLYSTDTPEPAVASDDQCDLLEGGAA